MPNPSIYDILNWQQNWKSGADQLTGRGSGYDPSMRYIGGQASAGDYLSDLLSKTGSYEDTLTGDWSEGSTHGSRKTGGLGMQYQPTSQSGDSHFWGAKFQGQELDFGMMNRLFGEEGFTSMGEDELRSAIEGIYDPQMQAMRGMGTYNPYGVEREFGQSGYSWEYGGGDMDDLSALHGMDEDARQEALYGDYSKWYGEQDFDDEQLDLAGFQESLKGGGFTPKYKNVGFEAGDLDELISYSQAMQEGMGRMGSISERFDLGGQLAGEERGAEREQRKALEAYIPREVASRYGALQSGGGGDMGEAAEAKYLAGLSSAQRRQGRNVRSIYGELEDEMFGGLGKWIQNMTSS